MWIIRGVEVEQLLALLIRFEAPDSQPGSNMVLLLWQAAFEPTLVDEKLLPIMRRVNPEKVVPIIRGVPPSKLIAILEATDVDGALLLCENTNTELAIRLMNGPLDAVLAFISGGLGEAIQNPVAAQLVRPGSDALNVGITQA